MLAAVTRHPGAVIHLKALPQKKLRGFGFLAKPLHFAEDFIDSSRIFLNIICKATLIIQVAFILYRKIKSVKGG